MNGEPGIRAPRRRRVRFGLRATLLVALLPLLTLPWIGLRFVERMAELARDERLDGLASTASTLAAALHERRDLFDGALATERLPAGADGRADEWVDVPRRRLRVSVQGEAGPRTLVARMALARSQEQPGALFLLVEADDERLVRPGTDTDPSAPGDRVIVEAGDTPQTMTPLPLAEGRGGPTERDGGWLAEYRIDTTARLLRVRVVDVDYLGQRKTEATADSGLLAPVGGAAAVWGSGAARAEHWNDTLRALGRISGRVSVFDAGGSLLVQRGDVALRVPAPADWQSRIARWLLVAAVRFDADAQPPSEGAVSPMARALLGVAGQSAQRIGDPGSLPVWLLTSAQPVWLDDRVVGALVLEESTASRIAIGQRALERLVLLAVAAVAASAGALLLVASVTVSRIVRLHHASERAIDARGRVVEDVFRNGFPGAGPIRDELGDLAASYARVLARLAEYQDYLGKLRSRLVHELRTPIMVVRSSIDNLLMETDLAHDENPRRAEFLRRTQQGAARLERIVASMSEAASLESLLADSELERVDLAVLVESCVQGYRGAFAPRAFESALETRPAPALVAPEAIVQALDKLVSNAVDFATAGTPIVVSLARAPTATPDPGWQLSVRNQGPSLPSTMAGSLFDSMVSVRSDSASDAAHLGLGLYLVRLIADFHGGEAFARDVPGGVEVGFTVPGLR